MLTVCLSLCNPHTIEAHLWFFNSISTTVAYKLKFGDIYFFIDKLFITEDRPEKKKKREFPVTEVEEYMSSDSEDSEDDLQVRYMYSTCICCILYYM